MVLQIFPFRPAKGEVPASQGKSSRRMGLWIYPQCLYTGWGGKAWLQCHIGNIVADNWRCYWASLIEVEATPLLTFWKLVRYPDPSGLPATPRYFRSAEKMAGHRHRASCSTFLTNSDHLLSARFSQIWGLNLIPNKSSHPKVNVKFRCWEPTLRLTTQWESARTNMSWPTSAY